MVFRKKKISLCRKKNASKYAILEKWHIPKQIKQILIIGTKLSDFSQIAKFMCVNTHKSCGLCVLLDFVPQKFYYGKKSR
jgi:hypothetical protein